MSELTDAVPDRVSGHVAAFSDAVTEGDYERPAVRFAEDAVMSFVGVPVGHVRGPLRHPGRIPPNASR